METETYKIEEEKAIEEIFSSIKEGSDNVIKLKEDIFPFCFLIKEDKTLEVFNLAIRQGNNWIATNSKRIRDNLFKELVERKIIGYIVIEEFKGTVTRTLFTPKTVIKNIVYKDSLAESTFEGRNNTKKELYDLW